MTAICEVYRFRLNLGVSSVECVVTEDAFVALGARANQLSEANLRFLEGVAQERFEWCLRPQNPIVIDAWDIETHRPF